MVGRLTSNFVVSFGERGLSIRKLFTFPGTGCHQTTAARLVTLPDPRDGEQRFVNGYFMAGDGSSGVLSRAPTFFMGTRTSAPTMS